MKKTAKDLKVGDTVWIVSDSSGARETKVMEISGGDIVYGNGCHGRIYCPSDTFTGMGMYAATVYFNKSGAIEYYQRKVKEFNQYIKDLQKNEIEEDY